MLASIQDLLVVQDRDRRLLELEKRIAALPAEESRSRGRLASDERAVADAKAALQRNGIDTKNLELDIETRRTTIGRLKQQQFETRKNEEFRALGNEVQRYEAEIDGLETRQLELMEEADSLRATLDEAEAALAKSRKVVDEDLANIAERGRNLEAEAEKTLRLRDEAIAGIDDDLRSLYDRLMKKKNGLAVAQVHDGQCGGCHVRLVPATLIKVNAGAEVTQCENCGRILYPEG